MSANYAHMAMPRPRLINISLSITHLSPAPFFSIQDAIFPQGSGFAGAVVGNPRAASFMMVGLPGKCAVETADRLTDHGVDPSWLHFSDFL